MKKRLSILTVLLILLGAAVALAACGATHEHTFSEWEESISATCTQEGERIRTCTECGEVEKETVQKTDHTPVTEGAIPATCLDAGQSGTVKCDVCGTTLEQNHRIEPLGHIMSEGWEHGIEDSEVAEHKHYHFQYCTREDCGYVNRVYCQLKEEVVQATCEADGFKRLECDVCKGGEVVEIYEKTGHKWGDYTFDPESKTHKRVCENDEKHIEQDSCSFDDSKFVDATCTAAGYTVRECKYCRGAYNVISESAPAKGHTYGEWVVDTQANCDHGGSQHKDCKDCGDTVSEAIPQRQHSWSEPSLVKSATCTEAGQKRSECIYDDCDEEKLEELPMIPHDYDVWKQVKPATCTSEGVQERQCKQCPHKEEGIVSKTEHIKVDIPAKAPDCETPGTEGGEECSVCHTVLKQPTEVPATGHKYEEIYHKNEGERTHYRECQNCDYRLVEGCDPTMQRHEATCVDAGYTEYTCRHCFDSYQEDETPAKGHSLSSPTPVYLENGEDGDHVHKHEQVCLNANCEHKVVTECKMNEVDVISATCTTAGYKKLVCPECQSVHEQVTEEARGHVCTYSIMEGTYPYTHKTRCLNCDFEQTDSCQMTYVEKKPTCVEKGETRGTCALCPRSVRRGYQVAALGHSYGAWEYNGDMAENHTHHRVCTRDGCTAETEGHEQTGDCHIVTTQDLPTCDKAGGSKTACDICLTSISENSIEALGHSFGQWRVDDKTREHYHTCNKCGKEEREAHTEIVNEYEATCEAHAKKVTTCRYCAFELVEEDTSDPIMGHNYQVESFDATEHSARCLNCGDVQKGAHDYSKSNICSYCPHDGLIYESMGAHYIVKSDDALAKFRPKKIIIPAEHSADDSVASLPVKEIARSAFLGNTYIEEVVLPVTLDTINDNAFVNCSALNSVSIEGEDLGALKTIGISAFMKCTSLTSFEAPATLETIGAGAFDGCIRLVHITIHDDVKSIGANAFSNTAYVNIDANWTGNVLYIGKHLIKGRVGVSDGAAVTEVEVRDGTVSINAYAFEGEAIASIILPDSLSIVEAGAFKDCTSLKKVEYKGDMAGWFKIDFKDELASPLYYDAALHIDSAHDRIVIPNGVTRIPVGTFRGTGITEVVIPDTVTYIGADAFEDCASLAKIEIPTSVTYIGKDAFKNCLYFNTPSNWTDGNALYIDTHLIATKADKVGEEFVVKAGTTTVGIEAFKDCEKLKHVTFASTVVRIGANAFDGCTSLSSVTFEDKESGWLASGRIMRFVSPSQIADPATARAQFHTYYGEWKKSSSKA